jgi:hypothetical protein
MSVADRNVLTVDVEDSQTLLEAIVALRQEPKIREKIFGGEVETVVLDTVDEVARLLQRERLTETRKETLAQADWGWFGDQLRGIIRGLRNLDLHVILTCHVKTTEDTDSGTMLVKPAVQGAVGDELAGYVDLALLMRSNPIQKVVDGEVVRETARLLQTYGTSRYPWIKDRSGKLPPELDINFEDDYKRIDEAIFGGRDIDRTAPPTPLVVEVEAPASVVEALAETAVAEPAEKTVVPETPAKKTRAKKTMPPPGVDPGTGEMEKSLIDPADDPHPPLPADAITEPLIPEPEAPVEPETPPEAPAETPVPETPVAEAGAATQEEPKNKMGFPDDGPPWKCADCGDEFEDPDQAALSRIRFRRLLDGKCFRAAKSAKK